METTAMLEKQAIDLLSTLIEISSVSQEEAGTASAIAEHMAAHQVSVNRSDNNIWAVNLHYDAAKPSILLNSHHDTVKPNAGYTRDPFKAEVLGDTLYGLGSNDAGAPLVSLMAAFLYFYDKKGLKYNLIFAATAEEENSGVKGISSVLDKFPPFEFAIVGEPTSMKMAVAEKALLVVDAYAKGVSGHAARGEGVNAIYKALEDIDWIRNYQFEKVSEMLGPVKITVTMIDAGTQHNVIPAECHYVIDIRTTDKYSNKEVFAILEEHLDAELKARSFRFSPSFISPEHPIVRAGLELGLEMFGSPTVSDQALISAPSLKIGPGDSARSHAADEYVKISEITQGIDTYIKILGKILL